MAKRAKKAEPKDPTPLTVSRLIRILLEVKDRSIPVVVSKGCGCEHAIEEFSGLMAANDEGAEVFVVSSVEVSA